MSADALDPERLAEQAPLAHPAVASIRLFDYSTPPGDHLVETYNALWMAMDESFPNAPTRVARLLPRGHGKTEGVAVATPTWAILDKPDLRVAVISKTATLAAKRTEKITNAVERNADRFGVNVVDSSRTMLRTEAGRHHKEPTVSAYGLQSDLTGNHFDLIVYDDIVDWDNQRTETQRRNVRNYFRDFVDNLGSNDSVLPNGPVHALIGTRKHPQDIYETDVLGSATWDVRVNRAIHPDDWGVVEARDWQVRGTDGELYASIADLPPDVQVAPDGVVPNRDVRVLWPEFQPPESLLYDIVDGDDSVAVWRRENQQDPEALSGEVLTSEMLIYEPEWPTDDEGNRLPLHYVAGLDLALVDDPQKAAEQESDYFALAVIGIDPRPNVERAYLTYLARERGLSVKEAVEWVEDHLAGRKPRSPGFDVDTLLVEQNAGRGVGQRLRDSTPVPAKNVSSTGDKHDRIHNLSADFQGGELRLLGEPTDPMFEAFETEEWLPFPTAAHDDMLDATELAMRAVGFGSVPTATASVGGGDYREGGESGDSPIEDAVRDYQRQYQNATRNKWK